MSVRYNIIDLNTNEEINIYDQYKEDKKIKDGKEEAEHKYERMLEDPVLKKHHIVCTAYIPHYNQSSVEAKILYSNK